MISFSLRTKPPVLINSFVPLHKVACTRDPLRSAERQITAPARVRYEVFTDGSGMEPLESIYISRSTGSVAGSLPFDVPVTRSTVVYPGISTGLFRRESKRLRLSPSVISI
jgi:hypothetical protein